MSPTSLEVLIDIDLRFRFNAMADCQKKGKTKAVGVSNFSQKEMNRLVKEAKIVSFIVFIWTAASANA